jgi:hypothetical protein
MIDLEEFSAILQERLPFLRSIEEELADREPVLCTDLSEVGSKITTPLSLQHVGEQIVEIATSDWMAVKGLDTVVIRLSELAELWETIFQRHREATGIFAAAKQRPYCLFLRSFTSVTNPIEVPGARVTMYVNEPELDANFATTLMGEADWLNPVSCMHTDDMQLLIRSQHGMPAFRVRTVNWQRILSDAIASSGLLILYVDGESPGVNFEIDCIREHGLESQTAVVYRREQAPNLDDVTSYAAVMHVSQFLAKTDGKTGPGTLSKSANDLLRRLASAATTRKAPTQRLLNMPCEVVDSGVSIGFDQADSATSYFVTDKNSDAFVNYVLLLPDSFLRWNAISQEIRLRGIQPDLDDYNALYRSLRMAFVASTCLGFTSSIACTAGLLAKVTSMAKPSQAENQARIERYMKILDIAQRFNALTKQGSWEEKIEAFRESILEDPFR